MSSVLKASSVPQNTAVPPQLNKPMHPQQGPPQSYGQPSNHHSIVSHGNPTAAHNHTATHQPNHFALNMPNSYIATNQPIPASNHPVPNNPSQPSQQLYSGAKNMSYQGGFQANLGGPQNQSPSLPPVTQSLPATNPLQTAVSHSEEPSDRTNGTSEDKPLPPENHVSTPKETPFTPSLPSLSKVKDTEFDTPVGSDSAQRTSPAVVDQQKAEPEETNAPSEDKTDKAKEDDKVEVEKVKEEKKEPAGDELGAAAMSKEIILKSTETEVDEKLISKRSATRKTSKMTKNEEEPKQATKCDSKQSPSQKSPSTSKSKRARIRTQPYQSPLPELEIISKISASQKSKPNDEKLIVFFKNEFLAVRNPEGSFYVCQAVQNIYKTSAKIRIRWLSLDKNDKTNQIYIPDFYDHTDFDCILTNLNLERIEKGKFRLPPAEKERTDSILKRSLAAEKGEEILSPTVNEEHPDGLDLSLYKDENQLNKRRTKKRKATSPLKSSRDSSGSLNRVSPDKSKLAKITPKSNKKQNSLKEATHSAKKEEKLMPSGKKTATSRTERAKRRSDLGNDTKVASSSPKVDQKKAKALAKVARKNPVQTPEVQTSTKKETKETRTVTKKATITNTKKKPTKRSGGTKK